eukprot:368529_1
MATQRQCIHCKQSFQSVEIVSHWKECPARKKMNAAPASTTSHTNNPWAQVFSGHGSVYVFVTETKQWENNGSYGIVTMFQDTETLQNVMMKWTKTQTQTHISLPTWWNITPSTLTKIKINGKHVLVLKALTMPTKQRETLAIKFSQQKVAVQFAKKYVDTLCAERPYFDLTVSTKPTIAPSAKNIDPSNQINSPPYLPISKYIPPAINNNAPIIYIQNTVLHIQLLFIHGFFFNIFS